MSSTHSWKIGRTIWNALLGEYFMRDDYSDAQTTIDYGHHEIHEGDHYSVEGYETLGSAGTVAFCLTTPNNGKYANMLFSIESTGNTEFNSYRYGSYSTGGTQAIPINSNHNSAGTSDTAVFRNSTIISLGSNFQAKSVGVSGSPVRTSGGDVRSENEHVLKENSVYIYHIKSNSADNVISYHGNWYEHAPSN